MFHKSPKPTLYLVSADLDWEERELQKAAKQLGFTTKVLLLAKLDLASKFQGNGRFLIRRTKNFKLEMLSLVCLLETLNLKYLDSLRSIVSNQDKLLASPGVYLKELALPPTVFCFPGRKYQAKHFRKLRFPVLSKPSIGRHGQGIKKHADLKNLLKFLKKNTSGLLIQNFLEIKAEYRILVLGKKILGIVKKHKAPGSMVANYAAGARFQKAKLPRKIRKAAVRLCHEQGLDFAGVDIAQDQSGNFYLLEINRCPQFRALSEACQVNVARAVAKFLARK